VLDAAHTSQRALSNACILVWHLTRHGITCPPHHSLQCCCHPHPHPPSPHTHTIQPHTDGSYKRLWSDVYQLGTLACLRAGLLARNALYEGNAIAAIYRVLSSSDPAAQAPATASHLLSILAALLQDVPAAFAAEGYAHLVYDAGRLRVDRGGDALVTQ
jgi:hypothetical protein